jgi:hypothetical protein
MGPIAFNPDSYVDVAFTGPEFGAQANRLVAVNTTGVNGENLLLWDEATLLATDFNGAWSARQVFYAAGPGSPIYGRATYGVQGCTGYLIAATDNAIDRFDASGNHTPFVAGVTAIGDIEFGGGTLYFSDGLNQLWAVDPIKSGAHCGGPPPTCSQTCDSGKVLVCHVPPGNPSKQHTICIDPAAVPAHIDHGDHCGHC